MHVYGPEMHVSGIVPLALQGKKTDIKEFGA
jgi:ATP citrate (pro-S)-lyase